jgi:lipid-A-disaccharide synthase
VTTLRIGLVAGESSGDRLGAALIDRLRELVPDAEFVGVGGPRMRAAGFHALANAEQLAVMGLFEVIGHLPRLWRLRRNLVRYFTTRPPDVFIGIDAPDFNLALEKQLKRAGISTLHWVSPSVWAWRRYRLRHIQRSVDKVLTLFPFEADFYHEQGIPAEYVGHPLADDIADDQSAHAARSQLGLDVDSRYVALLPGSRRGEVERLLPVFLHSALRCAKKLPDVRWLVPVAMPSLRPVCEAIVQREVFSGLRIELVEDQSRSVMTAAEAVLLASGTATLECLLVGRPMVVAYRMNPLSYALARRMLKVPYVSLPNNLLGRYQVPEYLQRDANPETLSRELLALLQQPDRAVQQVQPFAAVHQDLRRNAAARVANIVLETINASHTN